MRIRLSLTIALVLIAGTALADEEVTHAFSKSTATRGVHRVIIDIPAGEVTVRNGAANRIAISGEVRRRYDGWHQHEKAQRIANDVDAEIAIEGDDAIIRRRFGPSAQSWSAKSFHSEVKIAVDVPPGVDIEVGTHFGEVNIEGSFGDVDTDLRAGEVHVRTPRANVRDLRASVVIGEVHTNVGSELVDNEGVFPNSARFHNSAGKSELRIHATVGEVHVTLTQ